MSDDGSSLRHILKLIKLLSPLGEMINQLSKQSVVSVTYHKCKARIYEGFVDSDAIKSN